MKVYMDTRKLLGQLDAIADGLAEAARPAAQAGAQVFYDTVRAKAPVSTMAHSTKGKLQTYQPGNLRDAVYQVYSVKRSHDALAAYEVSVNTKKAFYWRFVEFGTKRMKAQPFLRPSYYAAEQTATRAASQTYLAHARAAIQAAQGGRNRGN